MVQLGRESPVPSPRLTRTVAAGAIGNVLEWYDFGLIGFFAPVISRLFFPSEDRLASLLGTYGVFATGYLMRPLGGVCFGSLGDRLGRKRALELSVLLMAVPTTLMALLPTHADVGLMAPLADARGRLRARFRGRCRRGSEATARYAPSQSRCS